VYQGVVIDYRGPDVNPTVFMNVCGVFCLARFVRRASASWCGCVVRHCINVWDRLEQVLIGQDPGVGSRKVLKSGPNDRVFINFADHGGVGLIAFPLGKIVTSKQLVDTLTQMVCAMYHQEVGKRD
jgi:hypothetical protein